MDLRLPGRVGPRCRSSALRELDPGTAIVVLTGYGSIATALEAMRLGATHYLTKPADADEILAAFARAEQPGGLAPPSPDATPRRLARVEWEHINRVLADCGGQRLAGRARRSASTAARCSASSPSTRSSR